MNEKIKILINELDNEDWHYFMKDGVPYKILFMEDRDLLLNYIFNLQNRIDKAIEYINDLYFDFYDYECDQLIVGKYMVNDLLDILKESSD